MRDSYITGRRGEALTVRFLEKSGYKILARNFRIKGGEIDIIAEKDGVIAFVEVKTRSSSALDPGEYAVTQRKKRIIIKTSQEYMLRYPAELQPRFDVAAVVFNGEKPLKFDYYDNAFSAEESDIIF